jgi:hypothetical protein
LKLALTEENPTIRPYDEAKWAELQDSLDAGKTCHENAERNSPEMDGLLKA